MQVLVLNCGSSSLKWKLIDTGARQAVARGQVERLARADGAHAAAIDEALAALGGAKVDAVGHRVVHGGERFHDPALIDDAVVAAIEACAPLAPLHNPANLAGIRAARAALPGVPQVAVFDTAFHHTLPRRAATYALDPAVAARHGIRRYGFHGTSHAFVARETAAFLGQPLERLRLVTLHLGNGASACAIEHGHSVETSMGFTPLEGLVMGTRPGDLDAGVVLALLREYGQTVDDVDRLLNQASGLAGLSGVGNDLREVEERAAQGDDRARLAIAVFAHRVRKYVGAYAAVMGGLDAVVLTAGIGENAVAMRRRILQRLEFLGLSLDEDRNADARVSDERRVADVGDPTSRVRVLVVRTDEELMIAEEAAKVVAGRTAVRQPGPIPIAVSARHVHLNQEALETLFGPGATLTPRNDLSQPGQFACHETVNLIGPRRRIDGVRILGPLRSKCQVEISRTDEFHLGVDAPVRHSGHVEGSAPITLEGPKGTLTLQEGLICAWRHIHMHPDDARAFGVQDGDEVQVEVSGGPGRDLIFGDVVIRVSPKFRLEMHIDTDEANAAELSQHATGQLLAPEGEELQGTVATARLLSRRPTMRRPALAGA
ncbi:MAG: acetate/propionate family kinase [Planctomycetes bacterium]|nr:acetate/propionate family kinase [Planctomycetota bacterium]